MKQDIACYVDECDVCHCIKAEHQRHAGTLQSITIPEWKWDHVEMDFITVSASSATPSWFWSIDDKPS